MINLRNAIALLLGCLINASVLATDLIDDKNLGDSSIRVSFQQDLIHKLENERGLEDKLSRESTKLLVEYREVLLFQSTHQIVEMMTSLQHPYGINTNQLSQCRQRINDLKKQLLEIGYEEEYVLIQVSFPKPNINRFGGTLMCQIQATELPHR